MKVHRKSQSSAHLKAKLNKMLKTIKHTKKGRLQEYANMDIS